MNNQIFQKICRNEHPKCISWLVAFQQCVQSRNYELGKSLFSRELVSFGTVVHHAKSLDILVESQWVKVWEATKGFEFHLEDTWIFGGDQSPVVTITALWSSYRLGETNELREGRCSITLAKDSEGSFEAVHTHFSVIPTGETV